MEVKPQIYVDDLFEVKSVDKDGKFFENVSRIHAVSRIMQNMQLTLDINDNIYPMEEKQSYAIKFASSLKKGSIEKGAFEDYDPDDPEVKDLIDDVDYIMHGHIYKVTEEGESKQVLASFGGLLMKLEGQSTLLKDLDHDSKLMYILIKKV